MFRNLCLEALGLSGQQDSELIESALSNGFKGVSLDLPAFQKRAQTQGLDRAKRFFESAKLKVGVAALPFCPAADDAAFQAGLAQMGEWATLSAQIGCTRWETSLAPASDERPYHANFEFYRGRLGQIAKALEPHGIRLGVGFDADPSARTNKSFEFIHSGEATAMLVGMAGARNLGLVVDLWQLFASGGSIDMIRKLPLNQIVSVRLADVRTGTVPGEATAVTRVLPGDTAVIDSAAVLVGLAEAGYDGPITPTADPARFAGQGRQAILKLTREALDTVWKAAGLTPSGKLAAPVGK